MQPTWSPPTTARRPTPPRRRARVLAMLVAFVAILGGALAPAASADPTGEVRITASDPSPPGAPKPTGSASAYTINFRCSAVNVQECGDNPVIRIPLDLTSTNPETPPMAGWTYSATSGTPDLVASYAVEGNELVIRLDPTKVTPGDSLTIDLRVTPPNNVTPNGTTWSLQPTFGSDDIPTVTAPDPALGAASASANTTLTKDVHDGSSFVIRGNEVIYTVRATCGSSSTGNLHLKSGSLVDELPPGLTFVSVSPAAPAPSVTGTPATGQTLTWDYPNAASLPTGCAAGASAPNTYTIRATIDPSVNDGDLLTNDATFTGLPIGRDGTPGDPANQPIVREDDATIRVLDDPPTTLNGFVGKTGVGPLSYQDGVDLRYIGTYPGNWMPNAAASPATDNPASAPGRFTTRINYGGDDAYQTDLVDPMPCLSNQVPLLSRNFQSLGVTAPTLPGDQPAIDGTCTTPAFHPTVVRVSALSLAAAVTGGWVPVGIGLDGTTEVPLEHVSGSGTAQYFRIPSASVGQISAIRLKRDANLTDRVLTLDVFGYADASTQGLDTLRNVVSVSAYPTDGANPITGTDDARLVIEDEVPQLGAHKSFGAQSTSGGRVRAPMTLIGRVSTAATPLVGDVVIADLLPQDMEWDSPVTSVTYNLTDRPGGTATPITGTVEYLTNHDNTGRNLIRITFPKERFEDPGYYTLTPQATLTISVPVGAQTYNNETRTYVQGSGTNTSATCTQGTTEVPAVIQSADEHDLDGDGVTAQRSCSWPAPLVVPPPAGAAFGLYKTVQGDLDSDPKRSPGVGEASEGGSGEYTLTWRNIGGTPLTDPVVYDILPYVGDTGVTLTSTPRDSAFRPLFTGMTVVPGNVDVQYSTSSNPCRPEVINLGTACDDNWTSAPPSDLSDVRALRFAATGTFNTNQNFKVEFGIDVPVGNVNVIAWNSAASTAKAGGTYLLAAEPPKVGIRAPAPLVTPTLTTEVDDATIVQGANARDTITIAGSKGATGDIEWQLVGPQPAVAGSCAAVDWTGSAVVDSGMIPLQGDDDYLTPTTALTAFGCYSYVVKVTSDFIDGGEVSHPAGALNEVVQVAPVVPTLTTQVSKVATTPGEDVLDTITLAGADGAAGTIDWELVGPKPIGTDGTCDAVVWTGASTVDSGSLPFSGSGDYDTTTSAPTGAGCYSYVVEVTSPQFSGPVSHPAGETNEVFLVRPATIVTAASSVRIAPGAEITDRVDLTGTGGGTGTLEWSIVGPIPANGQGTCENLDWSGAQTFDSGTIAVNGDGVYDTDPSNPTQTGCYSYVQLLNASSAGGPSLHAAGEPNEMFYVGRPTVETTVSSPAILPGGTLLDSIDVKGTGGGAGTLEWKLYGPVVPGIGDTCLGLNWTGATVVAQGTIPVTGDGTYLTPATPPLLLQGCYGYEVTLDGKDYGGPVVSPAGTPGELSLVKAPVVPQQTAKVAIEKTASHRAVRAGRQITYTLTASNTGAGTAHNVVITDTPQTGMRFVSATPEAGTCGTGFPLSCNVGSLAPGQKVAVKVVAVPTASGAVVNSARVTTDTPNESPANEVVADSRVVVKVPVRISKRAARSSVQAGNTVRFTVTVRNPTRVATGRAEVCDRMPSGLVMVSVRGAKVTRKGGQHCWTVPALKPGQSKRYTVTARALKGAKGTQTNRVSLKGDSVQTASARASVRVRAVPVRAGGVTG